MNKQTEALRLARDFISAEWGFGGTTDIEPSKIVRMLEEALAEQPAQQQKLVAYWYETPFGWKFCNAKGGKPAAKKVIDLYASPQPQGDQG